MPATISCPNWANSGPRWSIVGIAIACSTRSGTFVGPGIWRKWRPVCGDAMFLIEKAPPPASMRLVPVAAVAGLDDERHGELAARRAGGLHDRLDDPGGVVDLGLRRLEQQFVVDLQQHARLQPFVRQRGRDPRHRALD